MSDNAPEASLRRHDSDSLDCIDLVIDKPGDNTVRPLTGKFLELAIKHRDSIRAWEEWKRLQAENPDNPPPLPEI